MVCVPAPRERAQLAAAVSPVTAVALYATSCEHHCPSIQIEGVKYCPFAVVVPLADRDETIENARPELTVIVASR